jgi:chromosome segregation ATPase
LEYRSGQAATLDLLARELEAVRGHRDRLTAECAEAAGEKKQLQERAAELEQALAQAEQARAEWDLRRRVGEEQVHTPQHERGDLSAEFEQRLGRLEEALDRAEAESRSLAAEVETLQKDGQELRRQRQEALATIETLNREAKQKAEAWAIEREALLRQDKSGREELVRRLEAEHAARTTVEEKLDKDRARFEKDRLRLGEQVMQLGKEINQLREQRDGAIGLVQTLRQESAERCRAADAERESLETRLQEDHRSQIRALEQQLETQQARLQDQLRHANQAREQGDARWREAQRDREAEMDRLLRQAEELQGRHHEAGLRVQSLEQKIQRLSAELEVERHKARTPAPSEHGVRREDLERQRQELEERHQVEMRQVRQHAQEVQERWQHERRALADELCSLRDQAKELESQRDAALARVRTLQEEALRLPAGGHARKEDLLAEQQARFAGREQHWRQQLELAHAEFARERLALEGRIEQLLEEAAALREARDAARRRLDAVMEDDEPAEPQPPEPDLEDHKEPAQEPEPEPPEWQDVETLHQEEPAPEPTGKPGGKSLRSRVLWFIIYFMVGAFSMIAMAAIAMRNRR